MTGPGEFAAEVRALSGAETGPPADNFMTNEDSFPRACGDLARLAPPGTAYLGVGPDQNLTLVAHARPTVAVVLDYRRRNLLVHLLHKALLTRAADRVGYLALLTARAPDPLPANPTANDLTAAFAAKVPDPDRLKAAVADVRRALEPLGLLGAADWADLATIHARLAGPGLEARFLAMATYPTLGALIRTPDRDGRPAHFLAAARLYDETRRLQLANKVLPAVGDLARPEDLGRVGRWLHDRGYKVGVVYLSDLESFLFRSGRLGALADGLGRLPIAEGAVVVRSCTAPRDLPGRVAGDIGTTVVRPLAADLDARRNRPIRKYDDLFAAIG